MWQEKLKERYENTADIFRKSKLKSVLLGIGIGFTVGMAIFPNISFAQEANAQAKIENPFEEAKKVKLPEKTGVDFSSEEKSTLDGLLDEQNYISFYDALVASGASNDKKMEYLLSKEFEGHVPLYWLIADYYAKTNNAAKTHQYLYIATIMTQQDASICLDGTAMGASRKLFRAFPAAVELVRKTPELIREGTQNAIFFVDTIKQRSHPSWACNFGENETVSRLTPVKDKSAWNRIRDSVLSTYKQKAGKSYADNPFY